MGTSLGITLFTPDKNLKVNTVKMKLAGLDTPILIDMRPSTGGVAKRIVYPDKRKDGRYEMHISQTGFYCEALGHSITSVDMHNAKLLELKVESDNKAETSVFCAFATCLNSRYTGPSEEVNITEVEIL